MEVRQNSSRIGDQKNERAGVAESPTVVDKFNFDNSTTRSRLWIELCRRKLVDSPTDLLPDTIDYVAIAAHPEYGQVKSDVHRTLLRFPPNLSEVQREELLSKLTPLIIAVLVANPKAKYYQGFHDVCLTVLMTLGDCPSAQFVCHSLARTYFQRFLEQPMNVTSNYLEGILYSIIAARRYELYSHLRCHEVPALFALSWLITWFSHDCDDQEKIVRLYDAFLEADDRMPLYVAGAVVLRYGEHVLNLSDSADIYKALMMLPKVMDVDLCIEDARRLFRLHPPDTLRPPADYARWEVRDLLLYGAMAVAVSALAYHFYCSLSK